ncbi:MAG: thiamine diphosphokinase [Anaerolineae bacterium]|nr:thiamine diphosphokinase [Anaerolineae bacterium]
MRVLVFANGNRPDQRLARCYAAWADRVMCADGGANHASALGIVPEVLIGDLDSVLPNLRVTLEAQGTRVLAYPSNKDETDLELALLYAVEQGATDVVVLGALGGRIDHELGNFLLLAHPRLTDADIRFIEGAQDISLIHGSKAFRGAIGDLLSLLPIGGDVKGVTTCGLEYPLRDETLFFGPARGVSNVFTGAQPEVTVRSGLLLAVHIRHALNEPCL